MNEEARLFGIDLGTTYSCISYMDDTGRPVVCPNLEGDSTTPSVVRYLPDDPAEGVVGATAKETAVLYPEYTIQFVKAKIGRMNNFEYGPDDDRRSTSPVTVSADILRKLAADAGVATNTTVKDVVITVPAYFGQNEKSATKRAGEEAGLNVVDIVEEPTAAAFYYGANNPGENQAICIFDLGGGTFDVTAMKIENGNLVVLTTEGDHDLGGKNWDEAMREMVIEKFREQTGFDEEFDSELLQELQIKCETAKIQLTNAEKASIALKVDREHKANIEVTREEFEARTSSLLATAIDLTRTVIDRIRERGIDIDKILLVGGSSYMPQVKKAVAEEFGMQPEINDPNQSVSKGACIYCNWKFSHIESNAASGFDADEEQAPAEVGGDQVIDTTITETGKKIVTLVDDEGQERKISVIMDIDGIGGLITVATKSFGIRTLVDGEPKITNLIVKDTQLPVEHTQTFGTAREDMRNVKITIYQSEIFDETYEIEDGVNIGEGILEGLPAGLPEHEPIDLTVKLAENGLLEITGAHNGQPLEGKVEENYSDFTAQQ